MSADQPQPDVGLNPLDDSPAPRTPVTSPYQFSAFLAQPAAPSWWFTALTAADVDQKLASYRARLTSLSAYVDVDDTVKFGVVMVADGQQSWWYAGLTADQVSEHLTANDARLTCLSAYVDVDDTVKFGVVMVADGQQSWWYAGLTADQVSEHLTANNARPTSLSAYLDVDNTVKFAVAMIAGSDPNCVWYPTSLTADPTDPSGSVAATLKANPGAFLESVSAYTDLDNILKCAVVMTLGGQRPSWWYDSLQDAEISEIVSPAEQVALLSAHLPPATGTIRAAFIAPDLYLGTTWSSDGNAWPTGFKGSPYVGIGPPGSQPNAFGSPSFVYFLGSYRVGYLNNVSEDGHPMIASSPDGVSEWTSAEIVPPDGWPPNQDPTSTSPSLAVFRGALWAAFLQTHQTPPGAEFPSLPLPGSHWRDDDNGRMAICSASDGRTFSNVTQVFPDSRGPFFSPCPPTLAVFDDKLWMAFVSATPLGHVLITSSADGSTWSDPIDVTGKAVTLSAVSLASFNGRLWMALGATYNGGTELLVCSSPDGSSWSTPLQVRGPKTRTAPSLTTFANKLWLAFVDNNDPTFSLLICSSPNGTRWSPPVSMHQSTTGNSWPERNLHSPFMGVALCATTVGQASPAYKVMSVVYAPPGGTAGNPSSVTYGAASTASTMTSVSDMFSKSVSVDVTIGDKEAGGGGGFSFSRSATQSSSFTSTNSWTSAYTFKGRGTDGVDHSEDWFCLWLNPVFDVVVDPEGNLELFLGTDGPEMVTVWLCAHWLQDPASMPPGDASTLSQRGITQDDYPNILACNPLLDPAFDPTMNPGRFVLSATDIGPPNYQPATYPNGQPPSTGVTCSMSDTGTVGSTTAVSYGVSLSTTAGVKDVFSVATKQSFTWTDTSAETDTTTKTQTAAATIYGPSYGYSGTLDLQVYWDRIYQTFVFAFAKETGTHS